MNVFSALIIIGLLVSSIGLKAQNTEAEKLFNKGFHYLKVDTYKAKTILNEAISLDSLNPEAFYFRGIAHYKLENYDSALNDFNRAEFLDPSLHLVPVYKGFAFRQLLNYDSALYQFNKYIQRNPQDTTAYALVLRGKMRTRMGDFDGAISDFERAVNLDPVKESYYYYKFLALFNSKKFENALIEINKAIDLNPQFYGYYLFKGNTYHEMNKHPEAVVQYSMAIDLNDTNGDLYFHRGLSYFDAKKYLKAIEDFDTAIAYNEAEGAYFFQRGHAFMAIGKKFEACQDWYRAGGLGYYKDFDKIKEVCE